MPFEVVVLISGRGSNLQSLIANAENYQISKVISNNPNAPGLQYAHDAEIETFALSPTNAISLITHKQALYAEIKKKPPDLIVLAGFMQILEKDFVEQNQGKIVNVHPSLLPEFRGLDTHQRALARYHQSENKQSRHGCTVHFVEFDVDTGPIIAQAVCPIEPSDTEDSLAARVLQQEHRLFPWVVNEIAKQNICYKSGKVVFNKAIFAQAETLGFTLNQPSGI